MVCCFDHRQEEALLHHGRRVFMQGEAVCLEGHFPTPTPERCNAHASFKPRMLVKTISAHVMRLEISRRGLIKRRQKRCGRDGFQTQYNSTSQGLHTGCVPHVRYTSARQWNLSEKEPVATDQLVVQGPL